MKLAFQLAYKNLLGAGLRTWLNVGVLSFSFIIILFYNAWIEGWNQQAIRDLIAWEYGYGQLRHADYDPTDVFSIKDANGTVESADNMVPVLVRQASIYPNGRMVPVLVKGIGADQQIVSIPSDKFSSSQNFIPAVIGESMAESAKLKVGDQVLIRWRDVNGTFDAATAEIVDIFTTNVYSVDGGQLWIPINTLWNMTNMEDRASYYLVEEGITPEKTEHWVFNAQEDLLKEMREIIRMERTSGSVMYLLLLGIALLAIFDTQVLSVFRRQREIGTYIALGMTRRQVVGIFTVEGAMNSVFAAVLGAIYGTPLFIFFARNGITMPYDSAEVGITIASTIYPVYSLAIILFTVLLVVLSSTIVSYLPSRKIAKMDPVQALKGKIQ
jgi:ABC-type lipoprotein release transport system permease subunit